MANETSFSTDMIEDKARNDVWRALMKPLYDIVADKDDRNYQLAGAVSARTFGSIQIGRSSFNTQHYSRTPKLIAESGLDHYLIQFITGGDLRGDFNGVDVNARPGDIVIIDLAQTVRSVAYAGSRIVLIAPRDKLERAFGWRNLHGFVMRSSAPMTRLLFDFLESLYVTAKELKEAEADSAQEALFQLLGAGITGAEDGPLESLPVNLPMRKRILAYIDDNLANPLLGPHSIMQVFRLSRSHLYRAFASEGGVAKVIRDKRLDQAYRILVDRSDKPVSLKEIAYRCGFHDGAQFTHAFKARFNTSPRDAREIGAPQWLSDPVSFSYPEHISEAASGHIVRLPASRPGKFSL